MISHPLRYVYVPNEENSSKSLEMERIMREARLGHFYQHTPDKSLARMRELCKGLYSSSYEDSINSKVKHLTRAMNPCNPHPCLLWRGLFSDEKNLQGHPQLSETNNRVDTVVLDTPRGSDNSRDPPLFSHLKDSSLLKVAGKLLAEPSAALPDISLRCFGYTHL